MPNLRDDIRVNICGVDIDKYDFNQVVERITGLIVEPGWLWKRYIMGNPNSSG